MIWASASIENHDFEENSSKSFTSVKEYLPSIQNCFQRWIPRYFGLFKCESGCLANRLQIHDDDELPGTTCMLIYIAIYTYIVPNII